MSADLAKIIAKNFYEFRIEMERTRKERGELKKYWGRKEVARRLGLADGTLYNIELYPGKKPTARHTEPSVVTAAVLVREYQRELNHLVELVPPPRIRTNAPQSPSHPPQSRSSADR